MVRAAIIGLGRWGRSLVNSVHGKSDAIRFTRAYTRTRASAEEFCRDKGIPLAASYDEILGDPDIDAVVLTTPHSQHEAQVLQAAAARKHVHVEKPITLDYASAAKTVAALDDAGLVLAVGFCRRFHPSVGEIRQRLADGRLGEVVSIVARHTTSTGQFVPPDNWRAASSESPGGALTAVGVHSLDHMIEFAGRVRDVRCVVGHYIPGPSDDTTSAMLHFESGATGLLFCSVATATDFAFTLYGTKGLAEISKATLQSFRFVPTTDVAPTGPITAPPDQTVEHPGFDMLKAEMEAFAHAIEGRAPYPMPMSEVLHGMAVFDAIVESARTGEIVKVAA